jgi:hypothetical protein
VPYPIQNRAAAANHDVTHIRSVPPALFREFCGL